jgi:CheY-like chemotaxis protein
MRTNGESAVATVCGSDAGTYHVMLLDICMPHMDGYQVAQLIRLVPHAHSCERAFTSCNIFT